MSDNLVLVALLFLLTSNSTISNAAGSSRNEKTKSETTIISTT